MSGAQPATIQSTAGAVAVRNEKGKHIIIACLRAML